jgi:hypothetical protein
MRIFKFYSFQFQLSRGPCFASVARAGRIVNWPTSCVTGFRMRSPALTLTRGKPLLPCDGGERPEGGQIGQGPTDGPSVEPGIRHTRPHHCVLNCLTSLFTPSLPPVASADSTV